MKKTTTNDIEDLLAEAGVDFTVVDSCPDTNCELCSKDPLPIAA